MIKHVKAHLCVAGIFCLLSLLLFLAIDSSHPYVASTFIAFFAFEGSVYYFHKKDREQSKIRL